MKIVLSTAISQKTHLSFSLPQRIKEKRLFMKVNIKIF